MTLPERADYSLTESALSPFPAEPAHIKLPTIVQKEQRYFTPEEMEKVIDAAKGQYKALYALQFATGMRFGEVAGLHIEDLDFDNSVVHIRRSVYHHEETTPKTEAGYRNVDVHP